MKRASNSRKAAQEIRRTEVVAGASAGKTNEQMAQELAVHRNTISADIKALQLRFESENSGAFTELRKAQLTVLEKIEETIIEGTMPVDAVNAWRQVRSDIARLLGLNAESRSIVAHVSPAQDERYLEFKKHAAGLDESQLAQVFAFMDAIERKPTEKDASWFPPKFIDGEVSQ